VSRGIALVGLVSTLGLAVPAVVEAQPKPDFSGARVFNRQESVLSPAMAAVESGTQAIEHHEPVVRVRLTLVQGGRPFETIVERTTDGREVTTATGASSFKWDGDDLVFSANVRTPACEGTIAVRYHLENDGRRVRATENIRGCSRDQDNVWIFDRP
jgi:hypothetical protein